MKIIVVRHGRTEMNARRETQGLIDTQLDEVGIEEAINLRDTLQDGIEAIFCSYLKRAKETAFIIRTRFRAPIFILYALREVAYGKLEGLSVEVALDRILRYDPGSTRSNFDYRRWGGDCSEDRREELLEFLRELTLTPYDRVLVVAHAGTIHMLYSILAPHKTPERILNGSVHEFDV